APGSPSRTNAIRRPSGDHLGMNSPAGSSVRGTTFDPSASLREMSGGHRYSCGKPGSHPSIDGSYRVLEKRILVPSGDHDAHESFPPSVSRATPGLPGLALSIPD